MSTQNTKLEAVVGGFWSVTTPAVPMPIAPACASMWFTNSWILDSGCWMVDDATGTGMSHTGSWPKVQKLLTPHQHPALALQIRHQRFSGRAYTRRRRRRVGTFSLALTTDF